MCLLIANASSIRVKSILAGRTNGRVRAEVSASSYAAYQANIGSPGRHLLVLFVQGRRRHNHMSKIDHM